MHILVLLPLTSQALRIEIQIINLNSQDVWLGSTTGTKSNPEIKGTSLGNGKFLIEIPNYTQKGIRNIIFKKDVNAPYSQLPIWINGSGKTIKVTCTSPNIYETVQFEGSEDSQLYFEYFRSNIKKNELYKDLREKWAFTGSKAYADSMIVAERNWRDFQAAFVGEHPQSMIIPYIEKTRIKVPNFNNIDERTEFYKNHFLSQYDIQSPDFWKVPLSIDLVNHYCYYSTGESSQDALIHANNMLNAIGNNSTAYAYYLNYMFNSYSKISANDYDQVYVDLVENYVKTNKATFLEEEAKSKHLESISTLKRLMTGQIMPNEIFKELSTGKDIRISDLPQKVKLIVFWSPECSHCKHEIPIIINLLNEYKSKPIDVITVCNNKTGDNTFCNSVAKSLNIPANWNLWGLGHNPGHIVSTYDLSGFPRIYIVDSSNKILYRRKGSATVEELRKSLDKALDSN
jgi:thiol-disulfide isomerase/thioredoxin